METPPQSDTPKTLPLTSSTSRSPFSLQRDKFLLASLVRMTAMKADQEHELSPQSLSASRNLALI